ATRGLMPLAAAALQVSWLRLVLALPKPPAKPGEEARALCPCCGSLPVASVIHNDRQRSGVRYLHCSLCATEWHLERVKCSGCNSGKLARSEEHTSELQSRENLVCRLLLEKKKNRN